MVELRALGPIEASVDDAPVTLGGPKQLTVLALLIAGRGHPVSDDALIDGVWGDSAGSGARATLQTYVSNLRGALGDHAIARTGDAYRLGLDPREVDVWQFEAAVATARELLPERPSDAAQQLRGALDLWRGDPYGGARECERLEEDRRELEALRLSALEDRMEAELAGAGSSALLGELSSLAQQHPLRERLQGLHMLGLYRAGRQGDAIEVYERTRRQLADQLGVDVSPQLRRLHQRILEQDPELLPDDTVGQQVAPPSGQVTFLFTDIEGSTRLFHELGPSYPDALQRHRQILREVWNDHGGYEATVEGDGSLVAFGSAGDAVRAAVAGQRSLAGEDWPGGADLRVRMGLHTGLASPRNGNYISLTVHEAARVMSAAHGGQVLLSEETAKRLEHLPEAELHARGRFRLRGFDEPVRLYEIVMDGLEHDFGPLRATPADRHNLVRQSTETIGREELIRTVVSELDAGHVVTLTGPGGVGKTRVASEVGARAVDDWEHGVWLVDLAAVSDADLVAGAVADAVGAPTRPGGDRTLDLTTHLADRRCVIILDNCEHLVAACRGLLDAVANACRGVAVLATSREPLHVHRESVRPVTPLDLPPRGTNDAATVRTSSAGALFEARASDVRPEFAIDDGNAADVAAICRGLDGLPLLIELAAALVPFQTTAEIRTVLRTQAELLRSADPSESERHRSVAGLIGWSYDLLDEAERAAFRRLAVFGGSFSLGTATPALTVGDLKPDEVPRLVWSLVDRSLVTADLGTNGTRYRLLATIRHYGRQRLDETDETGPVATALATSLLDEIGPWLPTEWTWVTEVGTEIDNLRAIVNLLPDGRQELAQAIACSIGRYHDATQSFREGIQELTRYAEAFTHPSPVRVALLAQLATLHLRTGDTDVASELLASARQVEKEHGAPDWDDVAVDRARGEIARRRDDPQRAAEIARTALDRNLTDRGRSRMLNLLGTSLAALGDFAGAQRALHEQLEITRRLGFEASIASAHGNLAETALRLGELERAAHHQRACLDLAMEQGSQAMVAFSLIVAARLAGSDEDLSMAVRLHARADAMLDELGLSLYEDDQRQSDKLLSSAHQELGKQRFHDLLEEGRRLTIPAATELADGVFGAISGAEVDLRDDHTAMT